MSDEDNRALTELFIKMAHALDKTERDMEERGVDEVAAELMAVAHRRLERPMHPFIRKLLLEAIADMKRTYQ